MNAVTMDTRAKWSGDNSRETRIVALNSAGGIDAGFLDHRKHITENVDGPSIGMD
jgi:hypothetical protein